MQRWGGKFRNLAVYSARNLTSITSPHSAPDRFSASLSRPFNVSGIELNFKPLSIASPAPRSSLAYYASTLSPFLLSFVQMRHFSSKERKRKRGTPEVSKVKKIKIKFYSSYKSRFRTMKDGTIRRWKEGKRHNAHLKSKKAKRRLRQPAVVPEAFAKVMKKLGFCA